ncbi:MAG: hypothetical protein AAB457_01070 [Patescibacteria group bacterium]
MLIRVQVLIPQDILEAARLAAANRKLSFSKLVTRSLERDVRPKKKMSIYVALKKLAKYMAKKNVKLPPDFATNDKYLYKYP